MTNSRIRWLPFIFLAIVCGLLWYRFSYPLFSFINLSVDQHQAQQIAQKYMREEQGVDPSGYRQATVFTAARVGDQYLQKAIGYRKEIEFLNEHKYELFAWGTRFFKENQKEEYSVSVSAASGEVIEYGHTIDASASRSDHGEEDAKQKAIAFLAKKFHFDPARYDLHTNLSGKQDNRTDYTFVWAKKGVFIEWNKAANSGGAKLLMLATVSGDSVPHVTPVIYALDGESVIVAIDYGTKKLKNMGSDLGGAVKGFKDGMKDGSAAADDKSPSPTAQVAGAVPGADKTTIDVEARQKS